MEDTKSETESVDVDVLSDAASPECNHNSNSQNNVTRIEEPLDLKGHLKSHAKCTDKQIDDFLTRYNADIDDESGDDEEECDEIGQRGEVWDVVLAAHKRGTNYLDKVDLLISSLRLALV